MSVVTFNGAGLEPTIHGAGYTITRETWERDKSIAFDVACSTLIGKLFWGNTK